MDINEVIVRINELYHKSQNEGLTQKEQDEQKKLRQIYIENVRKNLKAQLDNIDIVEKDGTVTNLGKDHKN